MTPRDPVTLPDAAPKNWVDIYAPLSWRPWLRLGRFDRPVGIWLLFLPGAMGLAYASAVTGTAFPLYFLILFAIGSALMRAAGCAFNDLVDRDIDAKVERTRNRPIASGQITPKQAMAFIIICCLISLLILLQLGTLAIGLGVGSLALVAAYPFMKRITWWPQAWLGLTFNWGFLMAYAAVAGEITLPALLFYAGLVFWTIGYDTIYALQDIEDDVMAGVKSSARALGAKAREGITLIYVLCFVLTAISAALAPLAWPFYVAQALIGGHLAWQVYTLRPEDGTLALKLFKSNRDAGLIWVAGLILCGFTR
ncbi:4-hydroxybenzoate octaprenyltransferase [Asticcacaulis machinosus]|uniref:4-hydroxybenzoate octaprenyltransferase n=1 Tax=Asticcacaulis machinosus TaxID=2984211 RepID=A0ABT5HNM8_9CAUL|nr:4-hydroxybenzoate octaprenyltransferase [Asticcacaulis machinosus]MDC7677756.1 4-hydroxybenzoate octaprenyltransferase [Asticcacaulis machinosus]